MGGTSITSENTFLVFDSIRGFSKQSDGSHQTVHMLSLYSPVCLLSCMETICFTMGNLWVC